MYPRIALTPNESTAGNIPTCPAASSGRFVPADDGRGPLYQGHYSFAGRVAGLPGFEALSMRTAPLLFVLLLGGCAAAYHTPSDGRLTTKINAAYKERDACLARSVQADGQAMDPAAAARTAAAACMAETDRLIELINRDGDPRVAARIRQDSEFRANGMALRARGQESG